MSAINSILKEIERKRTLKEQAAALAYSAALKNPAFFAAEQEKRAAELELGKAEFSGNAKKTATAEARLKAAQIKRAEALSALNLNESDFAPGYDCDLCRDTGKIKGALCACAKAELVRLTGEKNGLLFNSPGLIESAAAVSKNSVLQKAYEYMAKYCEGFPGGKFRTHLIMGATGVGKSVLCAAAAAELAKTHSVLALSAFEMNNAFLRYINAPAAEKEEHLSPLLDCDLLLIDDLGTEPFIRNITENYLYIIISERSLSRKHLIINTNLSLQNLFNRYGDRIYSRLTDKSHCKSLLIEGADLRAEKR